WSPAMTVNTQELRELLEKATPGPWFHGAKNGEHKYCVYDKVCWTDDDGRHGETPNMVVHVSPDDGKYHDAAYIAAANPATVTALLDENEALRGERDVLADILRDALGPLRIDLMDAEADGDCEDGRDLRAIIGRAEAALNPPD